MYDAISFSENNWYGSARTVAMGNAVVAVGGDIGTMAFNPAGSAVSTFSQASITPGLSISTSSSSYAPSASGTFGESSKTSKTGFYIPNAGVIFRLTTGRSSGLKSYAIGISTTTNNIYLNTIDGSGVNSASSMYGSFAAKATAEGMPSDIFQTTSNPWQNTSYSWNSLASYGANMIAANSDGSGYLASTESATKKILGDLSQRSLRDYSGCKRDVVINFGLNFDESFYIGLNLGLPLGSYNYTEYFKEAAMDPTQFPIELGSESGKTKSNWKSADYNYQYGASYSGIYGKLGFIWLPVKGLRVGFAAQSPTDMSIRENWHTKVSSQFEKISGTGNNPSASCSPSYAGEYYYRLRTPYIIDVGLAYTFNTLGLISLDYELTDYTVMKFSDRSRNVVDTYFIDLNKTIKDNTAASHSLRAGVEINATRNLAFRGGYNFVTSPEKNCKDITQRASFGVGFQTNGAFFADLAVRWSWYPVVDTYAYSDYTDTSGKTLNSCVVRSSRTLCDIVLTLGLRF